MKNYALSLLLLLYITNQWSRYAIVYLSAPIAACKSVCEESHEHPLCASFECVTEECRQCQTCLDKHDAAFVSLKYATCLNGAEYGFLTGFGYIVVFVLMGLVAGRAADLFNRKLIIAAAGTGWALFTALQGLSMGYNLLLVSRVGQAFSHAFSGPASLSMIADLFPTEERAKANSIYSFGIYVGGGLSSLSLLMATHFGWRFSAFVISAISLVGAIVLLLTCEEPSSRDQQTVVTQETDENEDDDSTSLLRQNVEDETEYRTISEDSGESPAKPRISLAKAIGIVVGDKVIMMLFVAASLRFLGGFAIGNYLAVYYIRRFPENASAYSSLNALIVGLGGATSSYMGGFLSDRLKVRDARAVALVPAAASVLGYLPFFGLMVATDFRWSIFCLMLEYLIAESWFGPALSIMQDRVVSEARGITISMYLFCSGLVGAASPYLLGNLDDGTSWKTLQHYMLIILAISYLGAGAVFFAIAMSLPPKPMK